MAKSKTTDYMNVSYRLDDANTNDTIVDVSMNWANRTPDEVCTNLNTWLIACGLPLQVTMKK